MAQRVTELDTTEVTLVCTALYSGLIPQLQSSTKESSDVASLLRDRQMVSQYSFIFLSLVVRLSSFSCV